MTLIEALEARQKDEGLSHTAFAAKLGISAVMWQKLRNQHKRMGRSTLRGIVRAYPDLHIAVVDFLAGNGTNVPHGGRIGRSRDAVAVG